MLDIFTYDFILRAFVVGYACSVAAALLGGFLVASRQSVMSDMLAHASLAGVGVGVLLNFSPSVSAVLSAILSTFLLYFLGRQKALPKEAVSVLILSGGIAIAVMCISLAKNSAISLDSYLFGSILTVTDTEMYGFLTISLILSAFVVLFYNRFLCFSFDKDFFKSRFSYGSYFEVLFMLMVAFFVAFSIKIVGGLLISSLLVIPALAAKQVSRSFRGSLLTGVGFNVFAVTSGIVSSFYLDIPTTSAIVLSLVMVFIVARLKAWLL